LINDLIGIKELKRNPLTIERFLSDAKIPEIVRHIENETIIYTEYVTDVIEKLSKAVEAAGCTYALFQKEIQRISQIARLSQQAAQLHHHKNHPLLPPLEVTTDIRFFI
jgi:hypothetical protein